MGTSKETRFHHKGTKGTKATKKSQRRFWLGLTTETTEREESGGRRIGRLPDLREAKESRIATFGVPVATFP
jgi:hypothetical protein